MSVAYGGPTGGYAPPGRVNFGWIGESFELFKANVAVWIVATLMALVPSIISWIIIGVVSATNAAHGTVGQPPFGSTPYGSTPFGGRMNPLNTGIPLGLNLAIDVFSALYSAWLYGGVFQTAVKQVRGEAVSVSDIFSGGPLIWKMLGFNIVYGLAVFVGFLFCFVPGVLLSALLFPGFALIADGETVGNALSRSMDAMKRDMWNAAALTFVMGLLIVVSLIPCGLGMFVTIPMYYLIAALAYRDMIGMPGIAAPASPFGQPQTPGFTPGVWPPPPGPAPSFGQPPQDSPPRRSLGGDDLDNNGTPPPGGQSRP